MICHNRAYVRIPHRLPAPARRPPPPSPPPASDDDDDKQVDAAPHARPRAPSRCELFVEGAGKVLCFVATVLIAYAQARAELRR
jgi:hypothetical protein